MFPLPAAATYSYSDAFSQAKGGHHGTDIFAVRGMGVLAVADGWARATTDPKGGKVIYLRSKDGTRYYYAHLESWVPLLAQNLNREVEVDREALLGAVGTSGNAAGKSPHLHFQISPKGGGVVDPFPELAAVDPHVVLPNLGTTPTVPPIPTEPASGSWLGGGALLLVALLLLKGKRR